MNGNGTKVLVRDQERPDAGRGVRGNRRLPRVDVTLVRLIVAVLSLITGGAGVLAYLVAWAVIPEEGEKTSIAQNMVSKKPRA